MPLSIEITVAALTTLDTRREEWGRSPPADTSVPIVAAANAMFTLCLEICLAATVADITNSTSDRSGPQMM
jgi:hypothetical protein